MTLDFVQNITGTYLLYNTMVISLLMIVPRVSMKKFIILTISIMGVLYALNMAAAFIFGLSKVSRYYFFTISIPSFIYFFLIAKYRDGRTIFAFCFGDMTLLALSFLPTIAYFLCGNNVYVLLIGRILIFPIAEFFMAKYLRNFYLSISNEDKGGWWSIAITAAIYYVILMFFGTYPTTIINRPKDIPIGIAIIVAMTMSFIIVFRTLAMQIKVIWHERTEKLLNLQIHSFENTIKNMEWNEKKMRIIRHDLHHFQNTLLLLARTGSIEEIRKFIDDTTEILNIEEPRKFCENSTLNSALLFYIDLALEADCDVRTKILINKTLPIKDVDFCIVFANAIENAINACKKISDKSKRKIKITCIYNPQFVLEVANTYEEKPVFDENGIPVASKKDHGYGTQSIVAFVQKYNAILDYSVEDEWFRIRIMI